MSHADPFVLKSDECEHCKKPIEFQRIPCLTCFGFASYCSDDCMAKGYHIHNFECGKTYRRVVKSKGQFFAQRWQQCGARKGMPALLRQLAESVGQDSNSNIYLIRLPTDPSEKIPLHHPIKQVLRSEWRALALQTPCFDAAWRAFIRMASTNSQRLFVVVYASDLSFASLIAVGEPPIVQNIPCPCSVHSAAVTPGASL